MAWNIVQSTSAFSLRGIEYQIVGGEVAVCGEELVTAVYLRSKEMKLTGFKKVATLHANPQPTVGVHAH
jgi:hypothetical protein